MIWYITVSYYMIHVQNFVSYDTSFLWYNIFSHDTVYYHYWQNHDTLTFHDTMSWCKIEPNGTILWYYIICQWQSDMELYY